MRQFVQYSLSLKVAVPALIATAMLTAAGCGGNASTPAALPAAGSITAGTAPVIAAGSNRVTLSFAIPNRASAASQTRRHPKYVSASTQSVTVGVDSGNAAVATSNCSTTACTVTFGLPAGSHTLAVRLWDQANAAGNELASNKAVTCVVTANTANVCATTLYGLATSFQVQSSSANVSGSQTGGFAYISGAATPFTIVALDADSNEIIGAGTITPAVSTLASGISIATPAPDPAPTSAPIYTITNTNLTPQTLVISATPAPNSDGSAATSNVTLTGAPLASLNETFTGVSATANDWVFGGQACLTAGTGATPNSSIPACFGTTTDASPGGTLQLTTNGTSETGFVVSKTAIASASATNVAVSFDYFAYGGSGADGLSVFLLDATQGSPPTSAGAPGSGLGYANTNQPGIDHGYLGIGLDSYGNFSATGQGPTGGISSGGVAETIAVRGAALTNYNYLGGDASGGLSLDSHLASRPAPIHVRVQINLVNFTITVGLYRAPATNYVTVVNALPFNVGSQPAFPSTFYLGFAASTGGATDYHQIRNVVITKS